MNVKATLHKIPKETGKYIKSIAAKLPAVELAEVIEITGKELKKRGTKEFLAQFKERGEKIIDKKMYSVKTVGAAQAVNHEKRMRGAYLRGGEDAVLKYLEPYREKKDSK